MSRRRTRLCLKTISRRALAPGCRSNEPDASAFRLICRTAIVACAILSGAGCVQEMADQPRAETMEESRFFKDGQSSRPQVPGTVARDQRWEETPETTGKKDGKPLQRIPIDVDSKLLKAGRKQFGIWCSHCHGQAGYGDGMVVQRGFPQPPSYHIERLRTAPDGRLFEVITDGHGRMPKFGSRIKPQDRWAIVAYLRALQLSQNASPDALEASDWNRLNMKSPKKD